MNINKMVSDERLEGDDIEVLTIDDLKIELSECLLTKKSIGLLKEPTLDQWVGVFENALVFQGFDELIYSHFLILVVEEPRTENINTLMIDKFGATYFDSIDLSVDSRFYPAIENLSEENQSSNARKGIAVSLLMKISQFGPSLCKKINPTMKYDFDQTAAGDLANSCKQINSSKLGNLAQKLFDFGYLQKKFIHSVLLDVVYENKEHIIDSNNQLVFYLGEQLEQLFDPLTEYSPEQTEYIYKLPEDDSPIDQDDTLVEAICDELLNLQTTFTMSIVEFLQKFLIPLRIEVLNEEIDGLSTPKLNKLFPPTIDEVTRINCIFLDALKSSSSYGSFEMLKACYVTIPYFYKAYTRHEAATKNFSKDIKPFMKKFGYLITNKNMYSEMKIITIINGPQEILTKLKLILTRLWNSKNWISDKIKLQAETYYNTSIEVIDTFGKLETTTDEYSIRVFTPSGKILTELAKGWPLELQYKWLKRRVVGVFDLIDINHDLKRDIIVIFSDYVVFLSIVDGDNYYSDNNKRPSIADVLMNSLINEVPLPLFLPKLNVEFYCYIDNLYVSTYSDNSLRFDLMGMKTPTSLFYKVTPFVKASHITELCTKAKILEKGTAFHLFKTTKESFSVYSTAHELETYKTEKIKSKFALYLNIEPSIAILTDNNVYMGLFVSIVEEKCVKIIKLTIKGLYSEIKAPLDELMSMIISGIIEAYPVYFNSLESPHFRELIQLNEQIMKKTRDSFPELNLISPSLKSTVYTNYNEGNICKSTKSAPNSDKNDKIVSNIVNNPKNPKENNRIVDRSKYQSNFKIKDSKSIPQSKRTDNVMDKKKKRRSFIEMVSNLFQKKDIKENTKKLSNTPKALKHDLPRTAKKLNQEINIKSSNFNRVSSNSMLEEPNSRVSSVIHHKHFMLPNIEEAPEINHIDTTSTEREGVLCDIQQFPTQYAKSVYTIREESEDSEILSLIEDSSIHVKQELSTGNVSNTIYKQDERLSQIFNHDLFDEIVLPKQETKFSIANLGSRTGSADMDSTPTWMRKLRSNMDNKHSNDRKYDRKSNLPKKLSQYNKEKLSSHINIPRSVISKIKFTRSPSFTEIFQEMRLVLDENDESSNWRRIPSEVSLNERHMILNSNDKTRKRAAHTKKTSDSRKVTSQQSVVHTPLVTPLESPCKSVVIKHSTPIAEDFVSEKYIDTKEISEDLPINSEKITITPILRIKEEENTKLYSGNKLQFKVTKTSPTKFITKNDLFKNSNSNNISKSISYIDTIENEALEFSKTSQPDNLTDVCFKPQEELYELGADKLDYDAEIQDLDQNIHTNIGNNTILCMKKEPKTTDTQDRTFDSILGDLDFSSFHMSFDNTPHDIMDKSYPITENTLNGVENKSMDPNIPIFYHLPSVDKDKNISRTGDNILLNNEEPIWVSPSKLDIFNFNNQTDPIHQDDNIENKVYPKLSHEVLSKLGRDFSSKFDDLTIAKDKSYAYLGKLLTDDELSLIDMNDFMAEDKPVRLQFKK